MFIKTKNNIKSILKKSGYKIVKLNSSSNKEKDIDRDIVFSEIYKKCKKYTMTSKERMYSLYKAIIYLEDNKIDGDFVECGVWKGGSAMVMALTLKNLGNQDRKIYLYDTYEGMSEPTKEDSRINKNDKIINKWKEKGQKDGENKWCYASLSEVKRNIFSTGYPKNNLIFVKGKVEDTLKKALPKKISLLRLDTDWYESTRDEMIYLYPLLSNRGVLILDDYGYWAGSRKAVDEFFGDKKPVFLNRIDDMGRLIIKF